MSINCGPGINGDDTPPSPLSIQAELFTIDWVLIENNAKRDRTPDDNYNGLTLSVEGNSEGGSFTTNISTLGQEVSTSVWPANSNWAFSSDAGDTDNPTSGYILRDIDGVVCVINIIEQLNLLEVSFLIPQGSARSNGIEGEWVFQFEPAN